MTSNAVIDISGTTSITTGPECCSADCPIAIKSCAADTLTGVTCSGHGVCLSGSGVCHCFDGYVGDRCDACDVSYATRQSSTGHVSACVFLPGATLSPAAGNSSSTLMTNGDGSTGTVPIKFVLEVVGGLVTVAVVCGAVLLTLLRRRRARLGRIEHWPRHDGTTSRCASSGILPVGQVRAVPCRPSAPCSVIPRARWRQPIDSNSALPARWAVAPSAYPVSIWLVAVQVAVSVRLQERSWRGTR